jgi:hypothetical protein
MKTEDIKKMALAWKEVQEAANKKLDPVGKADADIDNDGDTDKTDEYLHNRRKAVSAAIKGKTTKEEVEQIDELSKKTLGSYVKKAAGDAVTKAYRAGDVRDKDSGKNYMKALGRQIGISTATSKLAKEEVELDEVSQETLRNYHAKAGLDLRKKREKLDKGTLTSKDYKQGQNRVTGLNRAANKMEEVELDEARKSDSYQFTHKPGDAESEKRLADLKKSVKGTGKRVVLQGRLGKDNPNAHKYSKDAPSAKYKDGKRVNSDVSGKSGGHSHQRIQKADAAHHDVYVYDRNESVELDELKKSTLGSYIKKANVDAMKHAQKSGEYNNPDQPKHFSKAMDRMRGVKKATDKLTKEEV